MSDCKGGSPLRTTRSGAGGPTGGFWIVCADTEVGPISTLVSAERRLAEIVKLDACRLEHTVIERMALA